MYVHQFEKQGKYCEVGGKQILTNTDSEINLTYFE